MKIKGFVAAMIAASALAHGQMTANSKENIGVGSNVTVIDPTTGKSVRKPVSVGDKIAVGDKVFTMTETLVVPIGTNDQFSVNGAQARLRPAMNVALYPLAVFSYAGALGGTGGTKSFTGAIVSGNYTVPLSGRHSAEFGGFYFAEREGRDVYQLDAKYYFNPGLGAQLAYLNLRKGNAPAMTTFGLYNLGAPAGTRRPWNLLFAIGAYWNLSKAIAPQEGGGGNEIFPLSPRQTVNFSYFLNGGITLSKTLSLTASHWYIRDRNSELNRFALGVNYRF